MEQPALSKREQKKFMNRQNIIDAAIQLFSSKPFSEVSMRAIAKHANISPALIYQYFDDQQHLFMVAFQIESTKLLAILEQETNDLTTLAKKYIQYMFVHDNLYQMMSYFMLEKDQHVKVSDGLHDITNSILSLIQETLTNDVPEERLKSASQLVFATLNGLLITYKNLPGRSNEATLLHMYHLIDVLVDTIKNGDLKTS